MKFDYEKEYQEWYSKNNLGYLNTKIIFKYAADAMARFIEEREKLNCKGCVNENQGRINNRCRLCKRSNDISDMFVPIVEKTPEEIFGESIIKDTLPVEIKFTTDKISKWLKQSGLKLVPVKDDGK